ncbi:MAG: hypothetical protein DRP41_07655, partial [Thermodesulfobacteriota bacterium]
EKTFFLQPTLLFKKVYRGSKEAREAIQGMANFSNYAIKWFRFIIFQKHSCLLQACLCRKQVDRSNKLPASTCFITLFIQPTLSFFSESF